MNQICTLRGHINSITTIESFNNDIITGDENGWIIWWNLSTREPNACWKGHDMTILTMKQIDSHYLLTHSKDSELRIWNLQDSNLSTSLPNVLYNEIKYTDDTTQLYKEFPLPSFNSIPINSLNYCNVDYLNGVLITPATIDSNNFDIYKVNHIDFGIERLIKNFNPYELYTSSNDIIQEIGNDIKRDGFGIMMRIKFINDNSFYIGFESGHLLGFTISYPLATDTKTTNSRSIINKAPRITLAYYNETHVPNPILSIECMGDKILAGSTDKKLSVHSTQEEVEIINVKNNGIQSIAIDTHIYIGLWNGLIKVYDYDFKKLFKFQRSLPSLQNITTNSSSEKSLQESNVKLSVLKLFRPEQRSSGSKRDMVLNKLLANKTVLIGGYNDGNVLIFESL